MSHFFTDSVENRGNTLAHLLERRGNAWLQPLASYAGGRRYERIGAENHWDSGNDGFREEKVKATLFRSLFVVPGVFIGTALKGLSFLSKEVRTRNANPSVYQREEAKKSNPYHEVTRRISNRQELEAKLDALPKEKVDRLASALQYGNWRALDEEAPYYALKLLKEGRITEEQFGTVQIYCQGIQNHGTNLKIIPLFRDNEINPEAKRKIKASLECPLTVNPLVELPKDLYDQSLVDKYFESMRFAPKSEQYFFYLEKDDQKENTGIFSSKTVSQQISFGTGINVFGRVDGGRMIPTIGMMQRFLDTFSTGDPVKINPVIGLSTLGDIRTNGKEDTRDMAIWFPGLELPKEADGFAAPGFDFTYHDFYHSILASGMPKEHRHRMIDVADSIDTQIKKCWRGHRDLTLLHARFIDMEFAMYRLKAYQGPFKLDTDEFFWFSVAQTEENHRVIELTKLRFWSSYAYNKNAYRRGIVEDLKPTREVLEKAANGMVKYMDQEVRKLKPPYGEMSIVDRIKVAALLDFKTSHPIRKYEAIVKNS